MIYNFNLGIGWASSGVEYAESYRANIFRQLDYAFKFVFTDMFVKDNIEHMTDNIGFKDTEVIWLYQYFTDIKIAPVSYTLDDLMKDFPNETYTFTREGKICKYVFEGKDNFYTVYMVDDRSDLVHRVERVSNGCLIRKDYYTYTKVFSEFYAPLEKKAHLYLRRFYNSDKSIAYEEIIDNDNVMYRMADATLYSKEELVEYMIRQLNLTKRDVVIIDRTTGIGQAIIKNAAPAKIGIVIHADHFSESNTDDHNILWNNFYEYAFSQYQHIDFYVTATDAQNILLKKQFLQYKNIQPNIITIPVGSIDSLKSPTKPRRKHSLITASRLANEKHIDWLIRAVAKARKSVSDITLDIYGKGSCEEDLKNMIQEYKAGDYVRLMGQRDLADIYVGYDAYISASTSEGFGLTLLEAVASGLPIIGFDVRYGNQTFIDDGRNGYIIDISNALDIKDKVSLLSESIVKLFSHDDLSDFNKYSYMIAQKYLTSEVKAQWNTLIKQII